MRNLCSDCLWNLLSLFFLVLFERVLTSVETINTSSGSIKKRCSL